MLNYNFRYYYYLLCFIIAFSLPAPEIEAVENLSKIRNSVVRIETTFNDYSYENPWIQPTLQRSSGTGFVIEGNRILTNAHVVSRASSIRVQRPNQRMNYKATVQHIAHDCDLAILKVDDPVFFQDASPLKIGNTPELNSPVVVIGYPIGGDRVSITRGVVSRMDMDKYSHSQIDWHMIIQVDAAINPGNSGGPAIQNGEVIGIAFQVLTRGENLGYLIPPVVLKRFLLDIEDNHYDGYIDLGVMDMDTENPVMREVLGLTGEDSGVLIYNVIPGSSGEGFLQSGDVLLTINERPISQNGDVLWNGLQQSYSEVIDNLLPGATIKTRVKRGNEIMEFSFPARKSSVLDHQRKNYDTPPSFILVGGLLFQPVDANLMADYERRWISAGAQEIQYRYRYFLHHSIYQECKLDVVFTKRLNDPVGQYADDYIYQIVNSVNGIKVNDFYQFVTLIDENLKSNKYLVIEFRNNPVALVLDAKELIESGPRILRKYGVSQDRYLEKMEDRE